MDQGHLADALSRRPRRRRESRLRGGLWRARRQSLSAQCSRPDAVSVPALVHGGAGEGVSVLVSSRRTPGPIRRGKHVEKTVSTTISYHTATYGYGSRLKAGTTLKIVDASHGRTA